MAPPPHNWDDPDAWLSVQPQGSRDAYRHMQRFTATVADWRLAGRLEGALEGSGVFRRFRDVLADRADEEGRWRVYAAERVRGRGRAWLAGDGCRPA